MSDHIFDFNREIMEQELARCHQVKSGQPIWTLARINNMKPRVVNVKKVDKLDNFMGC